MNLTFKSLLLVVLLALFGYLNYPTFTQLFLDDETLVRQELEQKYAQVEADFNRLSNYTLSFVELDKNGLRIATENDYKDFNVDDPVFKDILKDNFKLDIQDGKLYLIAKDNLPEDVFISEVSGKLNEVFSNVKRIKNIEFLENIPEIRFHMDEGKRLSNLSSPIDSILGDQYDWEYNSDNQYYSSQKAVSPYTLNLGLDLKGGTYLELGIDSQNLILDILNNKSEQLKRLLIQNEVDFDKVGISESNDRIELYLYDNNLVNLEDEDYTVLLEDLDFREETFGYTFSIKTENLETINADAIDQAIQTISNRINELGVKEPIIQKKGKDAIIVQLAGLNDPERAVSLIRQSAVLEFRLVSEGGTVDNPGEGNTVRYFRQVDPLTKEVTQESPIILKNTVAMRGDTISDAKVAFDQFNQPYVSISFNAEGADIFGKLTTENVRKQFAIILDDEVRSVPVIQTPITGGQASITGRFTVEEARDLALVLRSGALQAPLLVNQQKTIGASLGEDSIRDSLLSLALGMSILVLFMVVVYKLTGVFAILSLVLNLMMVIGMMAYFGATLTLAGIAGLILTIGMAVDANILIFERIREESDGTVNKKKIINTAFSRSLQPILDSNITTIMAALVLIQFGKDQIKGFGVTLSVGIICSVFSVLFFTKYLMELFYIKRQKTNISI